MHHEDQCNTAWLCLMRLWVLLVFRYSYQVNDIMYCSCTASAMRTGVEEAQNLYFVGMQKSRDEIVLSRDLVEEP